MANSTAPSLLILLALLGAARGAAPVLAGVEAHALQISYYGTPRDVSIAISQTVTVTDADGDDIQGATVEITDFEPGDELVSTDWTVPALSSRYSAGTLTLTGAAPAADYEAVLRGVKYVRVARWTILDAPNDHARTFRFEVTDANHEVSNAVSRSSSITTASHVCTDVDPCARVSAG